MKLPEPETCQCVSGNGNFKALTALGESFAFRFSDASSTLAASTIIETSFVFRVKRGFCYMRIRQSLSIASSNTRLYNQHRQIIKSIFCGETMLIDLESYLQDIITECRTTYGERLLYLGLQGSYLRGEAS